MIPCAAFQIPIIFHTHRCLGSGYRPKRTVRARLYLARSVVSCPNDKPNHLYRSEATLAMLLLLNRVSYDDIQQAARIFGERLERTKRTIYFPQEDTHCSCGRHDPCAVFFLSTSARGGQVPHNLENTARVRHWCLFWGPCGLDEVCVSLDRSQNPTGVCVSGAC